MHFQNTANMNSVTPISLNPPISSPAITSFTNVCSDITENMYVIMQNYRNDSTGNVSQVFTKIHNKVKEISYSEDTEFRNH